MSTQMPINHCNDSMKDSGIKWVGDIPNSWEVIRGKYVFKKTSRAVSENDEIITCFRDGEVTLRKNKRLDGFTESLKEIGYQGIRKGDLVIHSMDAFAGAVGVSDSNGKGSPILSVCIPLRDDEPEYHALLIRSMSKAGWIEALAKGIRERSTDFRYDMYAQQFFPKPSLLEQKNIRDYLKKKKLIIESIINKKQQLVELLQEKQQALITQAVTKGLDLKVKMKDSGVEWIGEIPEKWTIYSFKFLCRITTGSGDTQDREDNGKYPFYVRSPIIERSNKFIATGESILMSGDGAGAGRIFHYVKEGKFNFHQRVYRYYFFHQKIKPMFLFYYMRNKFPEIVAQYSAKSTVDSIRLPMISDFIIVIPSLNVQMEIVKYIEDQSNNIQRIINKIHIQIEKLIEFRSALIYNAVTGKIKV